MPTPSVDSRVTPAMLHILLALAEEELHGYGIMQTIEDRTKGAVEIGPGTLYRTLGHLLERGLIRELPSGQGNRKTYAITPAGREVARGEAERLSLLVAWANDSSLLQGAD